MLWKFCCIFLEMSVLSRFLDVITALPQQNGHAAPSSAGLCSGAQSGCSATSGSLWPHRPWPVSSSVSGTILGGWLGPPPGDLPKPGISRIAGRFFSVWAAREAREYWSGQPISSSGELPDPGVELGSPALQADSLPAVLPGQSQVALTMTKIDWPKVGRQSPLGLLETGAQWTVISGEGW